MIKLRKTKLSIFFAILVFCSFLLSGCWDSLDIDEKQIVTTIIFDLKDDDIIIYLETANTESGSTEMAGNTGDKFIVVKSISKTLTEMRDNLDEKMDKPIYLSGVRALLLTENFAKEYMFEYLFRFRADTNYRKRINTAITREDPEEIFKIAKEKKTSVGYIVEGILKTLDSLGKSFSRTTMRLLENISADYTGILLPCIGINSEEIALVGYTPINTSRVIAGFLPVSESMGMVFLKADKPKCTCRVPYEDLNLTVDVKLKKRSQKPLYENEKISFDVKAEFAAELLYGDSKTPYHFKKEDEKALAEILAGLLKEQLSEAIKRAQEEFNCDYYQFDDDFRIKYPTVFEKMDWEEELSKITTTVEVKVSLKTKWTMDYSNDERK